MDQLDFYELAVEPDFPDGMVFELNCENEEDEKTFSMQGIDTIVEQFKNFLLARTSAYYKRTDLPAKTMRVGVEVNLARKVGTWDKDLRDGALPFFTADVVGDLKPVDGTNRLGVDNG
jgi:hypothetical protein